MQFITKGTMEPTVGDMVTLHIVTSKSLESSMKVVEQCFDRITSNAS